MARAVKRPTLIVLASIAATAFAAPPVAGAERLAMAGIPMEKPAVDRNITLAPDSGTTVSRSLSQKDGAALAPYRTAHFPPANVRVPRGRKALRIDLFRLRVTRSAVDRTAGSSGWFLPSVVHIRVKQGATPGSKTVGLELPVAPYVVVESRLGPGGASDTSIRFKIHY